MKRFAAHYVFRFPDELLKLHYVELEEDNRLRGIFPLEKEMAGTVFYNGILFPVEKEGSLVLYFLDKTDLEGIHLLAAELRANDGGSYPHVQRLS
jgi:hypothetical protein